MKWSVLLLMASACYGGMIAGGECASSTMADFMALGSAGCTMHDGAITWSNISYSATMNGITVDPAAVSVSFSESVFPVIAPYFTADLSAPSGHIDYVVDLTFLVATSNNFDVLSAAPAITSYQGPGFMETYTIQFDVCEAGAFAPDCTGALHANATGTWVPFAAGATLAEVVSHGEWTGSEPTMRVEGIVGIQDMTPTPEPATALLVAPALGLLAWWRRRK